MATELKKPDNSNKWPSIGGASAGAALIAVTWIYMAVRGRDIASIISACTNIGLLTVAVVALLFTADQVRASREANQLTQDAERRAQEAKREAAEQAERDSRAAVRPYVYAALVPGLWGPKTYDLRIENVGRTPARGLIVEVRDWPLQQSEHVRRIKRFCENPRTLPPGTSHRLGWYLSQEGSDGNPSAMPSIVDIRLTYHDDNGGSWTEEYRCDSEMLQAEPVPQRGARATTAHGQEQTLKDIDAALRALNVHVGSLRH